MRADFGTNCFNDGIVTIYECMWRVQTNTFRNQDRRAAGLVDCAIVFRDWSVDEQRVADDATAVPV